MLKVTISTKAGETVTTADATEARNFVIEHAEADPITAVIDGGRFHLLMLWDAWKEAGDLAGDLGLNFAVAAAPREIYTVPVDPADATICEGCE